MTFRLIFGHWFVITLHYFLKDWIPRFSKTWSIPSSGLWTALSLKLLVTWYTRWSLRQQDSLTTLIKKSFKMITAAQSWVLLLTGGGSFQAQKGKAFINGRMLMLTILLTGLLTISAQWWPWRKKSTKQVRNISLNLFSLNYRTQLAQPNRDCRLSSLEGSGVQEILVQKREHKESKRI